MTVDETTATGVRVGTDDDKGFSVVATQLFQPERVVIVGRVARVVPHRTNHSFQIDWNTHVDLTSPACYINHSCDPNTGIRDNDHGGFDFVALREIAPSEEITWDYETSEYTSIAVPRCRCGAANCRKVIRGFRYRRADRTWRPTYLADYLRGEAQAHMPANTPRTTNTRAASGPVTGRCHRAAERQ